MRSRRRRKKPRSLLLKVESMGRLKDDCGVSECAVGWKREL